MYLGYWCLVKPIYTIFSQCSFIIFAIVYVVVKMEKRFAVAGFIVYPYMGIVLFLFALFYPVLSGSLIDREYAAHFLKWFESWTFFV